MKNNYGHRYPNYLTSSRTAIVREQKQFIKIAFAVHLSAAISAERYRSDSGALKSAVLTLVYFYIIMIVHKCQQSAKRKSLLKNPTDRTYGKPVKKDSPDGHIKPNPRTIPDTFLYNIPMAKKFNDLLRGIC